MGPVGPPTWPPPPPPGPGMIPGAEGVLGGTSPSCGEVCPGSSFGGSPPSGDSSLGPSGDGDHPCVVRSFFPPPMFVFTCSSNSSLMRSTCCFSVSALSRTSSPGACNWSSCTVPRPMKPSHLPCDWLMISRLPTFASRISWNASFASRLAWVYASVAGATAVSGRTDSCCK